MTYNVSSGTLNSTIPVPNWCKCCFRTEIKHGAEILAQKIKKFRPKIAVFNGKGS